jgi:hypothetical protein
VLKCEWLEKPTSRDELAEVINLMGAHRLVTLTGAGGIGKTRLALALARELRPHFADGVWVAQFSPLADPKLVPAAIAAAVGLELDGEELFQEALRWHRIGKKVAIATVVDVVGSASRPIGGLLIVDEGGIFLGSVSAGCVEGEVITAALDVIETSEPCLLEFGASEGVWEAGLPCGKIKVYVEPLD